MTSPVSGEFGFHTIFGEFGQFKALPAPNDNYHVCSTQISPKFQQSLPQIEEMRDLTRAPISTSIYTNVICTESIDDQWVISITHRL